MGQVVAKDGRIVDRLGKHAVVVLRLEAAPVLDDGGLGRIRSGQLQALDHQVGASPGVFLTEVGKLTLGEIPVHCGLHLLRPGIGKVPRSEWRKEVVLLDGAPGRPIHEGRVIPGGEQGRELQPA